MDRRKLIYSILKELEQGNKSTRNDYGIELEEFGSTLEMMQSDGLIKGAMIQRAGKDSKICYAFTKNAQIEMKGLEYLEENSALSKTYKGIKELVGWLKP